MRGRRHQPPVNAKAIMGVVIIDRTHRHRRLNDVRECCNKLERAMGRLRV